MGYGSCIGAIHIRYRDIIELYDIHRHSLAAADSTFNSLVPRGEVLIILRYNFQTHYTD